MVEEVVKHPEMALASQMLQDILAEAGSRPWVLEDHAEIRSTWTLERSGQIWSTYTYGGAPVRELS